MPVPDHPTLRRQAASAMFNIDDKARVVGADARTRIFNGHGDDIYYSKDPAFAVEPKRLLKDRDTLKVGEAVTIDVALWLRSAGHSRVTVEAVEQ